MTEPRRFVEIEVTFDADESVPVPDWTALPEVVRVDPPQVYELDALYVDTADAALGGAGVAIRRRTGGTDAGWHLKGPLVAGARVELQWDLGHDDSIPAAVRAEAEKYTDAPLEPLARIRNTRRSSMLRDARGDVVAEFVDDAVRTTDLRAGHERAWREWELELGPAAPETADDRAAFFATVVALAHEAGAGPASSASKLARALGF